MKTPFFITGLPRSRTAWLANLFTTDTTVCFHEPAETVPALVAAFPEVRIGVADSTLPMRYAAIAERWPEARWLYVERDPSEAMRSFVKFTRNHYRLLNSEIRKYWQMHQRASEEIVGRFTVDFEELQRPEIVAEAWEFLLPEVPFNPLRLRVLENLKVEQDIDKRIREVNKWQ